MAALTPWDHVLALTLFLVFPVYSARSFPKTIRYIREHGEAGRLHVYRQVILTWLGFAVVMLLLWGALGRSWADLGLRGSSPALLAIALLAAALFSLVVVLPLRKLAREPDGAAKLGDGTGDLFLLLPETSREESWFRLVSINAGVSEELIFRGYLVWYLQSMLGIAWASVLAILLFGFAHLYQGVRQLPGILLTSAVAVGLYVFTGSLLVPVLFHIALDALQGHYIARIKRAGIVERANS